MRPDIKYRTMFWIAACFIVVQGCAAADEKTSQPLLEAGVAATPERLDPEQETIIVKGQEYITGEWGKDLPENHQIEQEWLDDFRGNIQNKPILAALLVKDGSIIFEYYKEGYHKDSQFDLYSCAKSITSAAVGIAVEQGYLTGVETTIGEFFPDITNAEMKEITIEQLLNFTSGIDWSETSAGDIFWDWLLAENQVEYILNQDMNQAPGEVFNYNSGDSHLISAILTQVTEMTEEEYLNKNLFRPIGIHDILWWADTQGITYGGFGIWMTTRDAARFGQLYLNEGKWGEEQIVPAKWVKMSVSPQEQSKTYGYNWWIDPPGEEQKYSMYYAAGHGGQYIFVVPELQIVAVVTSEGVEDSSLINLFKNLLNQIAE